MTALAWRDAADQVRAGRELPLDVVTIGETGLEDRTSAWREQSEVGPDGAVLVRPDHYVAWRATGSVSDPVRTLRDLFDAVLPVHAEVASA